MINWIQKKRNKKGFTLIELIVVIAILGILAAIAIPRLTGFRASAVDQTNEANAKMLTSVAQIVNADTGSFPTAAQWPMTDNTVTVAQATINGKVYITEDVVLETGGTYTGFSYAPATGIVSTTTP